MVNDSDLQKNVIDALKWDPGISHEHIGVSVNNGVVSLFGTVPSFIEKYEAEKVASKVIGVQAIVEKIEVKLPYVMIRDDDSIAKAILERFKWSVSVPENEIKVTVSNGGVKLTGSVDWEYQRKTAEKLVRELTGVKFVTNSISIKPKINSINIKDKIEQALFIATERESNHINVDVDGSVVTLSGNVKSLSDLKLVEGTVWGCPGVTKIKDHLKVTYA